MVLRGYGGFFAASCALDSPIHSVFLLSTYYVPDIVLGLCTKAEVQPDAV